MRSSMARSIAFLLFPVSFATIRSAPIDVIRMRFKLFLFALLIEIAFVFIFVWILCNLLLIAFQFFFVLGFKFFNFVLSSKHFQTFNFSIKLKAYALHIGVFNLT